MLHRDIFPFVESCARVPGTAACGPEAGGCPATGAEADGAAHTDRGPLTADA